MPSKQQLLEDNDVLLDLLADIDDAVDLPDRLQDRVDEWFEPDDDDDGNGSYNRLPSR
jgi:hypothetical protein